MKISLCGTVFTLYFSFVKEKGVQITKSNSDSGPKKEVLLPRLPSSLQE